MTFLKITTQFVCILGLLSINAYAKNASDEKIAIIYLNSIAFPVKVKATSSDSIPPDKPQFVVSPPGETTQNSQAITIRGEIGAQVYVNGIYVATIGTNGNASVVLNTSGAAGAKSFSIVLRDAAKNASSPLIFSIMKTSSFTLSAWTRTNPGAGGTLNMIGATASGVLVTASDLSGVYISEDRRGDHWVARGETSGLMQTTHMSALGFHPTHGNTFYVGTGGGLYKTTNLGQHFNFLTFNLPDTATNDTYVESVVGATDGGNTDVIYASYHKWETDSPSKIAKSVNGGLTWIDVSIASNLTTSRLRIVKLLVHPLDANIIYAISGKPRWGCSPAKAYRSIDGGSNWNALEDKGAVLDIDVDPTNINTIYMTTFTARECQALGEESFSLEDYVLNDGAGALYKSVNKGDSFGNAIFDKTGILSVDLNNSQKIRLVDILTMANAWWMENVEENSTGTWESNNGGSTWAHVGSVADWHTGYSSNPYSAFGFAFNGLSKTLTKDIFNSNNLYGANGWSMASFDGGITFSSLSSKQVGPDRWISTGLENINGYVLDVNDSNPNVIYFGGYDIGMWTSRDRGLSWKWQYPFKDELATLDGLVKS